ncbi:MAG: response regulator [Myxococcota bacterium]|jgi:CheY-like chemotaxis protein
MKHKVLVIDDDMDIRESMRIVLEKEGLDVVLAEDSVVGYKAAKEQKPDLILLDVIMNTQDEGFQAAYKFHSDADLKDIPIVMITSVSKVTGFQFDKEKDQDFLPVADFLEKPVSPAKLMDVVRKYLGK